MGFSLNTKAMKLTFDQIKSVHSQLGFPFYERPYSVNIGGIRNNSLKVDEFNDILFVAYYDDFGNGTLITHRGTTKPGLYYLKSKQGNINGTFILKEGFYARCWKLGMHNGQYEALVQSEFARFIGYRDNDSDGELDYSGKLYSDVKGLNCHTTSFINNKDKVGAYSAGCQVRQDDKDHLAFMAIVKKSMELYGNFVSYSLTNFNDYQ